MLVSRMTQKGQATIPSEIRNLLSLKPGDNVLFSISEGKIIIKKLSEFDVEYAKAIEFGLASEWDSESDNKAYNDL